ncbi:phiSA1p31-related protein [Streptomyces sp. t39]|uniref:phiSA1p31-related protein n=1 Tax=Streptomyces sp. t39 TaxID=1828156 RepID=UPI0011CE2D96|nr:phiSA1p31-related protein [Streptomyces sp. t39]TXS50153.1 hypothetical protein EAO77_27990 [Streptomyces sp. t39]
MADLVFRPCNPFEEPEALDPSEYECPCPAPDDQYLLTIDEGGVFLTHKACGKAPRGDWWQESLSLTQVPVTLTHEPYGTCDGSQWHGEHQCDCGTIAVIEVNDRAVMHDGLPYLIGRDYTDRDSAVWRITDNRDRAGKPLVFVLPEGAGEDIPLGDVVSDFGPLTLAPVATKEDGQ